MESLTSLGSIDHSATLRSYARLETSGARSSKLDVPVQESVSIFTIFVAACHLVRAFFESEETVNVQSVDFPLAGVRNI